MPRCYRSGGDRAGDCRTLVAQATLPIPLKAEWRPLEATVCAASFRLANVISRARCLRSPIFAPGCANGRLRLRARGRGRHLLALVSSGRGLHGGRIALPVLFAQPYPLRSPCHPGRPEPVPDRRAILELRCRAALYEGKRSSRGALELSGHGWAAKGVPSATIATARAELPG